MLFSKQSKAVTMVTVCVSLSLRDPADVLAECDLALASTTVTELAEARRTTYLSGRWIWDDQNGETSISISSPPVVLPGNGDCSAYYSWVEEKSSSQGPGECGRGGEASAHLSGGGGGVIVM